MAQTRMKTLDEFRKWLVLNMDANMDSQAIAICYYFGYLEGWGDGMVHASEKMAELTKRKAS